MASRFKAFLLLALASLPVLAQNNPLISGDNPSVQLGGTRFNLGTMRVVAGTGLPTTVTAPNGTALVLGDYYIDTAGGISYQCMKPSGSCTSVGSANWVIATTAPSMISVAAYGVNGTSTDPTTFQAAIDSSVSLGACLYIPANFNVLLTGGGHVTLRPGSCILGANPNTSLIFGSGTNAGFGLLDIPAGAIHVRLEGFGIDGGVNSANPPGIDYSTVTCGGCGPMIPALTTGTSIWAHGDLSDTTIKNVTVAHTGGYAMLFDATNGNISQIKIQGVTVKNSRPHLFGVSAGQYKYGAWTSGILFHGPGSTYNFKDLLIEGSTFQNVVGNALWWSNSTGVLLNQGVTVRNNQFIDIGLDAVQIAWTEGYMEYGNTATRVGYIITSDVGATRVGGPMWLQNFTPVAYDSYGITQDFLRIGNGMEVINGEGYDLDGAGQGLISGNHFTSCWNTADPLADQAHCGPSTAVGVNWSRGIGVSNSTMIQHSVNMIISNNTLLGVGNSGITFFGSQNGVIMGNNILQIANNGAPIVLGNLSTNATYHAVNNLVTKNIIDWNPPTGSPAIVEDGVSVCTCPFTTNEANIVNGNLILPDAIFNGGHAYEFQKDPNDRSTTGPANLSSVTPGVTFNHGIMQVEGGHPINEPAIKFYTDTGSAGTQVAQMSTSGFIPRIVLFGALPGVVSAGQVVYCSDCQAGGTCTTGGTGHLAVTNGTVWKCD